MKKWVTALLMQGRTSVLYHTCLMSLATKAKMFCFPRQWKHGIKERKGEETFCNTVPFLWTSWTKIFHKTEFLIHGLCFPQMDEKWIIISEEDRRPGAVRTIAVSHEPGAHFFMTTLYILLCPWDYYSTVAVSSALGQWCSKYILF